MNNQQIIMNESIELMNQGIIKGTGQFMKALVLDEEGSEKEIVCEIPEPIHTYASWKQQGRQVKKGEKAKAQFPVWKYKKNVYQEEATNDAGEKVMIDIDNSKMFLKLSFFFTIDQTEAITK